MAVQYQTKQELVYAELRGRIQSAKLRPGDWLSLTALADEFGVSPIPVREALKQLQRDDLVEVHPHRRALVKGITPEEAIWIAELRLLLEPNAARAAVPQVTRSILAELADQIKLLDRAIQDSHYEDYIRVNHAFHSTIYGLCPNRRHVGLIEELWEAAQRFRAVYRLPGHISEGQEEHRQILDALKGGDADGVEAAVYCHRSRILNSLKEWLTSH